VPGSVEAAIRIGASRQEASTFFLDDIRHYVYAGDTALHIAAASHQLEIAQTIVGRGGRTDVRNRRGAEPLHYAADGNPATSQPEATTQAAVVEYLIVAGAAPNALDASGVAPLHRAVRTRCSAAVRALLDNGADPRLKNKRGSTPLHLAVQNTGRSDSGAAVAKDEQGRIVALLLERGAHPADTDAKGKTAAQAATSAWVRDLLQDHES
jgi:hypothetical protein